MYKRCTICGEVKPQSEFHRHKRYADGFSARCKPCTKTYAADWYGKNKARRQAVTSKWKSENRESFRKYQADYYAGNRPRMAIVRAKSYRDNRESRLAGSRSRYLKCKYDLTPSQYAAMSELQGHLCAICGKPETSTNGKGKVRKLAVDHCHASGSVRALLCQACNTGIGLLGDSPELLSRAMDYLNSFRLKAAKSGTGD